MRNTSDWLCALVIVGLVLYSMVVGGCTADLRQEATFTEPGLYECSARDQGYEDLPVYVIHSDTAEPKYRQGFGVASTITVTTVEGKRVTFHDQSPPGYWCVKVEAT